MFTHLLHILRELCFCYMYADFDGPDIIREATDVSGC